MRRTIIALFLVVSLSRSVVLAGPEVEVTAVGRDRFSGVFESCDADAFAVRTASGVVRIPFEDIVEAVFLKAVPACDPQSSRMILENGDVFCGRVVGGTSDGIGLEFADSVLGRISLPDLGRVRWLLFPPAEAAPRITKARSENDIVTRRKGGAISGSVVSFGGSSLKIERGELALAIEVPFDDLKSVYIAPLVEYRPPAGLSAFFTISNGSRLTGSLTGFDGSGARVKTHGGLEVQAPAESVVSLGAINGRFVYVSDLEPSRITENPWLVDGKTTHEPPYAGKFIVNYKKDLSYAGKPISINGRTYLKGIGSHSWTEIEYAIGEGFVAFEATVGIDDCAGAGNGSVIFRVMLDGKEAFSSPVMIGGAKPVDVRVPLSGSRRMSLVVDFAKEPLNVKDPPGQMELHTLDRASFALARLVKKAR